MRVTADGASVRDLGSRNGTLVNGGLVESERQLQHGDQVQIGPLVFEVHLEASPATKQPSMTPTDAVTLGAASTPDRETTRDSAATFPGIGGGINDTTRPQPALPTQSMPPGKRPPKLEP